MMVRTVLVVLASAAVVAGCDMIPKAGKEARKAAYSRMDAVTAQVTHQQAVDAFETGQLERAETLARGAIDRFPEVAEYHALLGRTLLEQQRLDEARSTLVHAITMNPEDAQSRYFLGCVYERWSQDDRAAEQFAAAAGLAPEQAQYAIAAGEAHIGAGQLDEASEHIEQSLGYFAHHPALWHLRAHVALLKGDSIVAAAHCQEARLLAPEDPAIAGDLCRMRYSGGDWGGCLDAIDDYAMRFDDMPGELDRMHARCLAATGRQDQARVMYRSLANRDLENVDVWRERGLLAWDQRDWGTVAACGERLASIGGGIYEADLYLALHDRAEGRDRAARDRLESLVERFSDRPEAWAVLANVRKRLGDSQGSTQARDLAIKWASFPADESRVSGVYGTHGP